MIIHTKNDPFQKKWGGLTPPPSGSDAYDFHALRTRNIPVEMFEAHFKLASYSKTPLIIIFMRVNFIDLIHTAAILNPKRG